MLCLSLLWLLIQLNTFDIVLDDVMLCLRRVIIGLTSQRAGFDPKLIRAGLVVEGVALERGFIRVTLFSPVIITQLLFHMYLLFYVDAT
jgi:hypothetical protein